jgi:Uma2 family endonuclease
MPGDAAPVRRVTAAEYRLRERDAGDKHMLWNGEVFAMAGASIAHNRLVGALLGILREGLRASPCEAFPSDMRVWVPAVEGYVYPDVTVACPPLDVERIDGLETLRNPRVLVEVLSESSEGFDRGAKFDGYRSIATFSEYVLVSSVRREVDHFVRQPTGAWLMRAYRQRDRVSLTSVDVVLSLDELYERVLPPV